MTNVQSKHVWKIIESCIVFAAIAMGIRLRFLLPIAKWKSGKAFDRGRPPKLMLGPDSSGRRSQVNSDQNFPFSEFC